MLPEKRVIAALSHYPFNRLPFGKINVGCPIAHKTLGHKTIFQAKRRKCQVYWQKHRNEIIAPAHKFKWDVVPAPLILTCHTNFEQSPSQNQSLINNIIIFQATSKRRNQGCVRKLPDSFY